MLYAGLFMFMWYALSRNLSPCACRTACPPADAPHCPTVLNLQRQGALGARACATYALGSAKKVPRMQAANWVACAFWLLPRALQDWLDSAASWHR